MRNALSLARPKGIGERAAVSRTRRNQKSLASVQLAGVTPHSFPANDQQQAGTSRDHTGYDMSKAAEFLSVDEAAELLRVNRNSLYAAIKRGEVPGVVTIGRVIRIRRSALLSNVA